MTPVIPRSLQWEIINFEAAPLLPPILSFFTFPPILLLTPSFYPHACPIPPFPLSCCGYRNPQKFIQIFPQHLAGFHQIKVGHVAPLKATRD
ncbi:hypothetical protein E2C01_032271 [Portunus trituberculatus]|uniref:Uncharacterized protein n=1 Tax=Portunus trituberculatus TaxID=210409 RepID=A0A5B7EZV7_PORTR|nr:hypothetical protein [Portunus trituberculatus]